MAKIITTLDIEILHNTCLIQFLLVISYQDTEHDKHYLLSTVCVTVGKKIFNRYINTLKDEDFKNNGVYISYSSWLNKWKQDNEQLSSCLDSNDLFLADIGSKIMDILKFSEMLSYVYINMYDSSHPVQILEITDKSIISGSDFKEIVNLPLKLPMTCPPKDYKPGVLGGYVLKDEKFADQLFIEKKAYGYNTELSGSKIYTLINNISKTPFKINKPVLDYIDYKGDKHKLLLDSEAKHKYEDLTKLTKHQRSVLSSSKSKVFLQETILDLAGFYSRFSQIYFPVRLDQRGRLYCSPSYLNYQSNDLARGLILFAEPGTIRKKDMASINYLKAHGANCYGGTVGKSSIKGKVEWVDKNIDNIINYDNGVLLDRAHYGVKNLLEI